MEHKSRPQASFIPWRFHLLLFLIFVIVLGLVTRLVDLTILKRGFLEHEGNVRALRVVNTPAFRGMITDRNGFPLAVSTTVFSIWVNPHEFNLTHQNLKMLAPLVAMQPKDLQVAIMHAQLKHREFLYLKRGVAPEFAEKIKKLALPGVFMQEEYKRYYPEAEVAAHVVGFTNIDDKGQEGLELAYNDWLTGQSGKKLVVKDRLGRIISNIQTMHEQQPGKDLALSIDRRVQYLAYRELMEGVEKNIAASGTVVVLDVKTGEILAMVNQPSFNPNKRPANDVESYRNRAVTDIFEPGSTIKAFSIATVLGSGKFTPDTVIETSPGWMRVGRSVVRDERNFGTLTLAQVLQRSSNVGTTKMILSLPPQHLWNLLHGVGFGESTGIGFPGEREGLLVRRDPWKPFALATLAFGYGISVTPLQLAQAYAVFANGGIKKPVSIVKIDTPPTGVRVLDPKVAKQMLALLESVTTEKGGTGSLARVPGYNVAGKTGTAVIVGAHGYEKHHYTSTFVGMAPVSDPRFVVAVVLHDPKGKQYYGGMVSAPVFEKIMEGTLRLYNVPPDDSFPETAKAKNDIDKIVKMAQKAPAATFDPAGMDEAL